MHSFGLLVLATLVAAKKTTPRGKNQGLDFEDNDASNVKSEVEKDNKGKSLNFSPDDTSGYLFTRQFGRFGQTRFGYFLLDYDRPLYLTNGDIEYPVNRMLEYEDASKFGGLEYSTSAGWAKFMKRVQRQGYRGLLLGKDTFTVQCGNYKWAAADLDDLAGNSFSSYPAFFSHGTSRPLEQLARVVEGAIKIDVNEIEGQTLAIVLPIQNAQWKLDLPDTVLDSCTVTFKDFSDTSDESDFSLVGKKLNGKAKTNRVLAQVNLPTPTERACGDQDIQEIIKDLNTGIADLKARLQAGNITNLDQLSEEAGKLKGFAEREDVMACRGRILGNLKTQTGTIGFKKTGSCMYRKGTDGWKNDPCCNKSLAQCCSPSDVSVTVQGFASDSTFLNICGKNSDAASSLLADFDSRFQSVQNVDFDYKSTFEGMRAFLRTCQKEIWGLPCQKDGDCASTNAKCDVSSKRCMVDYTNMNKNYLRCIAREVIAQDAVLKSDPSMSNFVGSVQESMNALIGANFSYYVNIDPFNGEVSTITKNQTNVIICESWASATAPVSCPGTSTIRAVKAVYGRTEKDLKNCLIMPDGRNISNLLGQCGYQTYNTKGDCAVDVSSKVAPLCNGRNNCTVTPSNTPFGDPCGCTYKYLSISYECWNEVKTTVSVAKEIQRIANGYASYDCVGPNSDDGRSRLIQEIDNSGNKVVRRLAGDQTKCLARTAFNYRWWEFVTPAQQAAESKFQDSFCGDCSNGYCNDITQYAYCAAPFLTASECSAQGGYYRPRAMTGKVEYDCIFTDVKNASACINMPVNNFVADPLGFFAMENRCVLENVNLESAKAKVAPYGADAYVVAVAANSNPAGKVGSSISGVYVSQSVCATIGGKWWTPRFWRNGQFDTPQTCVGQKDACSAPCYDSKGMRKVCESETECKNGWECDDFELMNPNTNGNTCYRSKTVGSDGFAQPCALNERETSYGCARDDVTKEVCATLSGFEWVGRATTQNQCRNRIVGCQMDGYVSLMNFAFANSDSDAAKNAANLNCDKCGGASGSQYTIYPGTWTPNGVSNFQWVAKKSNVVNQWVPAVTMQDVEVFVNKAIMNTLSSYYLNWQSAQLNAGFVPMQRLLCACKFPSGKGKAWKGGSKRADRLAKWAMSTCFDDVVKPLVECKVRKNGKIQGDICSASLQFQAKSEDEDGSIVKNVVMRINKEEDGKDGKDNKVKRSVNGATIDATSGIEYYVVSDIVQLQISNGVYSLKGEKIPVYQQILPEGTYKYDLVLSDADGTRLMGVTLEVNGEGNAVVTSDISLEKDAEISVAAYLADANNMGVKESGSPKLIRSFASNLVAVMI